MCDFAISPDEKHIVSGASDGLVKIWDAATGAEVSSVVGVRLGWQDDDGVPRKFCSCLCWKWSEATVRWQVLTLLGHSDSVYTVAISADGKRIVSGSTDKLVKIWDAATGVQVSSFVGVRWGEAIGV